MPYDPERHHRRSIRAQNYDYAGSGTYFVTICTVGREMLFGEIRGGGMAMNEFGWLAWEEWEKSAELRPWISLDDFVVMPNHLHGLVTISPDDDRGSDDNPSVGSRAHIDAPLRRKPRSLGTFVGGFKGATTAQINTMRETPGTPVWQRNYYERIVRDEQMRDRIRTYIEYNPLQWSLDRENPDRDREDDFETWLFADQGTGVHRP
jgi:putative transposase